MIYMIHKKDNTNDSDKYRGITLETAEYKTLAKILTRRLTNTTKKMGLIHEAQEAAKIRQVVYNEARTLHDILENTNQYKRELHVCYIDLTKVYNMIEYKELKEILEQTRIDTRLLEMIMEMNTNNRATVITDFEETKEIKIQKGICQGCPLSPLLFCLYIEPLLRWIWQGHIRYRMTNNQNINISILAYIDDLVIITETRTEIEDILTKIKHYTKKYNIMISKKSTYTNKENTTNRHRPENMTEQEALTLQKKKIKKIPPSEVYKYLGF